VKWHVDYGPEGHPGEWLPKPEWSDEAAVTRWVCQRVDTDDFASIEFVDHDMQRLFATMEREAVAAAKNGDFAPLAELLSWGAGFRLGGEANALIAAKLTNRHEVKRGRPVLTDAQRKARDELNATHAAACEVKAIERWFRQCFPRERGRHDRAVSIAVKRHGIKPRVIANYLRSKHRV
jgi:hypothetical protein